MMQVLEYLIPVSLFLVKSWGSSWRPVFMNEPDFPRLMSPVYLCPTHSPTLAHPPPPPVSDSLLSCTFFSFAPFSKCYS